MNMRDIEREVTRVCKNERQWTRACRIDHARLRIASATTSEERQVWTHVLAKYGDLPPRQPVAG